MSTYKKAIDASKAPSQPADPFELSPELKAKAAGWMREARAITRREDEEIERETNARRNAYDYGSFGGDGLFGGDGGDFGGGGD